MGYGEPCCANFLILWRNYDIQYEDCCEAMSKVLLKLRNNTCQHLYGGGGCASRLFCFLLVQKISYQGVVNLFFRNIVVHSATLIAEMPMLPRANWLSSGGLFLIMQMQIFVSRRTFIKIPHEHRWGAVSVLP